MGVLGLRSAGDHREGHDGFFHSIDGGMRVPKKKSDSSKKEVKTTVKLCVLKLHETERTAKRSKTKVARLKETNAD